MVRSEIFKSINFEEKGFSFCPELNTKLSNMNIKIYEIPINYYGRTYEEGKKSQPSMALEQSRQL